MERQPLPQFISALVEHRKQRHSDWGVLGMKCDRLKEITVEMQRAGMFRIADNHSVLWHCDLSASNCLIHQTSKSSDKNGNDQDAVHFTSKTGNNVFEESVVESAREESVKAYHHTVELRFLERGHQVAIHTIELDLAGSLSGITCHHTVRFSDGKGRFEGTKYEPPSHDLPSRLQDKTSLSVPVEGTNNGKTAGEWSVSGVLDWDDALAVPLVLSRVPPLWLWLSEDKRPPLLTHDRDVKPGEI
ncbi:hypothetical protein WAI453_011208 [Rhynchosporium graminicola]